MNGWDDMCVTCRCPRWEHWRERLCTDWDLLGYSNACPDFIEARAERECELSERHVGVSFEAEE